jgi:hypothetical protein
MRKLLSHVLAGSGLALSVASNASAHIQLLDPAPRYEVQGETGIKSCPCGLGGSNRTCNVAADGSDPDRSTRVSRFEAGSTITVRFNEFVNHSGRFRVAFDPDGADVADFNANILNDIPDPDNASNTEWEIEVTLPDMTCTNCTLQLVQAMNGDMVNEVVDPSNISSYYACVDLELVAPGTLGDPAPAPSDAPGAPAADAPAPTDPPAADEGAQDDGAQNGAGSSEVASDSSETPLIPTAPPPSDTSATTGAVAPTDTSGNEVAMNTTGMLGTTGQTPSAPSTLPSGLNGSPSSSSSGGCSLGVSGSSGRDLGLVAFGLLAVFGLRQRSRLSR